MLREAGQIGEAQINLVNFLLPGELQNFLGIHFPSVGAGPA
jgi:hypothetical protein